MDGTSQKVREQELKSRHKWRTQAKRGMVWFKVATLKGLHITILGYKAKLFT